MLNVLFIVSFSVLTLSCIPFWVSAFLRSKRREPLLDSQPQIASPIGLADVMVMFTVWFMGQLFSIGIATVVVDIALTDLEKTSPANQATIMIIVGTGQLISTALGLFLVWFRYREWRIFGLIPQRFQSGLRIGGLACVMVLPPILILQFLLSQLVPYEHDTLEALANEKSSLMIFSTWFTAVLVAPVCEEIFFRGILQNWLQRLGGKSRTELTIIGGWSNDELCVTDPVNESSNKDFADESKQSVSPYKQFSPVTQSAEKTDRDFSWNAILISSAFFGVAHVGQGLAPIPLFVFGIGLGYLYRRTGSLWPCIVLHMGLNGFSMFWFTLNVLFGES